MPPFSNRTSKYSRFFKIPTMYLIKSSAVKSVVRIFIFLNLASVLPGLAKADIYQEVSNFSELSAAIGNANSYTEGTYTIRFLNDISAPDDRTQSLQQFVGIQLGGSLIIDGGNYALDMKAQDRAFYVGYGDVKFQNLSITNGLAAGGAGGSGAGGGMGAGGGIYVANGKNVLGSGLPDTTVRIENVSFTENAALGGAGGTKVVNVVGGGGGMGGNGGQGFYYHQTGENSAHLTYGGGGGFGVGADGGNGIELESLATDGGQGAYSGGGDGGQGHGSIHGLGGEAGGGGGASYTVTNAPHGPPPASLTPEGGGSSGSLVNGQAAGGGGVDGGSGIAISGKGYGGIGGYGGGGGASSDYGGDGGFGGGGGRGASNDGGKGGFGGGGGTGSSSQASHGGFGGGDAHDDVPTGGGGMGAGGALFIEKGVTVVVEDSDFSGNQVAGGAGYSSSQGAGSAIGANVFLGSDLTYQVTASTRSLAGVGGGGDTSDANVAGRDTHGDAQGGLIKTGAGKLELLGQHSYAGATQVREGTLTLATNQIHTSGYQVEAGATLEIFQDGFNPKNLSLEANAHLLVSGSNISLNGTTFSKGTITIDGSATGLVTSASNEVTIKGRGTLDSFSSVATLTPDGLTLNTPFWQNGTTLAITLGGNTLVTTGQNHFTGVDPHGLTIFVSGLQGGVHVGSLVDVITFTGLDDVHLSYFQLVSDVEGFSGRLVMTESLDSPGSLVLGVEALTIPEPGTLSLLLTVGLGLFGLRFLPRSRRAAPSLGE